MANVFLNGKDRDIETAIMLENAYQLDIGNAVAYTDGDRVFINTDDNLYKILPAYDHKMLKWLLWHERYHMELRHHNRYFKYLEELDECRYDGKFHLSRQEVNIIMDILVHDSLAKLFPELVDTATSNLAQMRNRNSLGYTFKTNTLEDMLREYNDYKKDGDDEEEETEGGDDGDSKIKDKTEEKSKKKGHGEAKGSGEKPPEDKEKMEDEAPKIDKEATAPEKETLSDEHDKTDWSKLDKIDEEEFIRKGKGDRYIDEINRLKRKKFKLGKLTETLNGLATSTRSRTYSMPNPIKIGKGVVLKGSRPGYAKLYLCFDASGSMGDELQTFKDIISKSIPQAMETPTAWFSGDGEKIKRDPDGRSYDYYKGKFNDIMSVYATGGYSDDGDRTIELCLKAEKQGYSPIGVTDGGGRLSWSIDMLKELKRTVLVGQNREWLEDAKRINPKIQILDIDVD